jgi:hypothetical protein
MLEWIKASYSDGQVQDKAMVCTLSFVETVGRYHIYKVDDLNLHLVVFHNQSELRDYMKENVHSVFAIKLLLEDNNKYMYQVEMGGTDLSVYTIARACVLVPGTEENPTMVYTTGREIFIR